MYALSDHDLGYWGLVVSIGGVALGVLGFAVTFWQAYKARTAAEAARDAAQNTRLKLLAVDVLAALDRVLSAVRELQYLHRGKVTVSLLHARYEATMNALLGLHADVEADPDRYAAEARVVKLLISEIQSLQEAVEDYNRTKVMPDFTKENVTLGKLATELQTSRERLRARLGDANG